MQFLAGQYEVAVIGAGHAGIEAALAAARLGCHTVIFTINMDWVGNMPCNPSIGGTAKGHLVREIDALGGEMGRAADANLLQSRMLNRGKGPAVHSLRAQIDRRDYSAYMKHVLETTPLLDMRQGEIVSMERTAEGSWRLTTRLEAQYEAKAVVSPLRSGRWFPRSAAGTVPSVQRTASTWERRTTSRRQFRR